MTWRYGTISNATSPADELVRIVCQAALDSGYYVEVESPGAGGTVGNGYSSGGFRWRVLYNATAGFHAIIKNAPTGTTNPEFFISEGYNPVNHTISNPSLVQGWLFSDYSLGSGNTSTAATTGLALGTGGFVTAGGGVNTTGFTYAISATVDRIMVTTLVGTSSGAPVYIGRLDPNYLYWNNFNGSGPGGTPGEVSSNVITNGVVDSYNYFTRYPYPLYVDSYIGNARFSSYQRSVISGTPGSYNNFVDGILVSRYHTYPVYYNSSPPGVLSASSDYPRGLLVGVVKMATSGSYAFGDELTYNNGVSTINKYKVVNSYCAIEMI